MLSPAKASSHNSNYLLTGEKFLVSPVYLLLTNEPQINAYTVPFKTFQHLTISQLFAQVSYIDAAQFARY